MCAHRRNHHLVLIAAIAVVLSGCKNVPMLPGLTTYRIDIQQGNVVTQDMIDKLKPGMTRQQVRFVMGTPPIVDPFHKDRWDYVYYLNKAGKIVEHRRLVLLFDGDVLKRVEGDVVVGGARPEPSNADRITKPPETMTKPSEAMTKPPETMTKPPETTAAETQPPPQAEQKGTP